MRLRTSWKLGLLLGLGLLVGALAWLMTRPTGVAAFDDLRVGMSRAEAYTVLGGAPAEVDTNADGHSVSVWKLPGGGAIGVAFDSRDRVDQKILIGADGPSFFQRLRFAFGF
jgi:hypothetical protein